MPVLDVEVDLYGRLLLEMYVAVSTSDVAVFRESGRSVAGPRKVVALIDTGAGQSQVDLSIIGDLEIFAIDETRVFTASTAEEPESRDVYSVDLALAGAKPGPLAINLRVVGSDSLAGLKVQMLLGRDVLDRCLLAYDGPNRRCSLAYDPPIMLGAGR